MLVSFPHMGELYLAVEKMCNLMAIPCVVPARPGPTTLKKGSELAPEGSCLPFCLILGNMQEALELGADTLMMLGGRGPCRFGYFIYLAEKILKEAGYDFQTLIIDRGHIYQSYRTIRNNTDASWSRLIRAVSFSWRLLACEEFLRKIKREGRAYAVDKKGFDEAMLYWEEKIKGISDEREIQRIEQEIFKYVGEMARHPEERILKIGLVGDIYTLLEPYANHGIEEFLMERGVSVYKEISVVNWLPNALFPWRKGRYRETLLQQAFPYLKNHVGGFGLESVAGARRMRELSVDGVLQLFPLGCMPEIVAHSALNRMCVQEGIPIMSMALDGHQSATGLETRLEAFLDMVNSKHKYAGPCLRNKVSSCIM